MPELTLDRFGGIIFLAIVAGLFWYFRKYISRKAEDLATKEDIQEITRLQEEVKAEFDEIRERQRSESQLRLAVVERRFQAHQEAYTLWIKLARNVHKPENFDVARECQLWWDENGLYLDPDARSAFRDATFAAFEHPELLQFPRGPDSSSLITDNFKKNLTAGPAIEAAVNLPPLDLMDIGLPSDPEPNSLDDDDQSEK